MATNSDKINKKESPKKHETNIFQIIKNDITSWCQNIYETLFYKENGEGIVQLHQQLKIKKGVQIQMGQKIEAEDLVEKMPEGTTVSLIEGENIDTNKIGEITVKIQISEGTKNQTIETTSVTIVESKIETDKEKIEKVKLKKELDLGDKIEAKDLLEGLPEGGEATFKDGIGINKKDGKDQEITIIVKIGEEIKEIPIIAKVIILTSGEQHNVAMIGEGMKEIQPVINKKLLLRENNDSILDEGIFRLQIGKMQEDGGSIYTETMLRFGIEYMINHTKKGEHSIIQIWSEVGDLLQQGSEKGVLSPKEQQKKIERFIEKNYGKRGKCIKVIIGSEQEQHVKVFNELKKAPIGNRRFKIIPKKEPSLKELKEHIKNVSNETSWKVIQYLAYHANKDEKLMELFYNTKPEKYKKQDGKDHKKGSIDADYYGIIEVGLRLTEILKGISIQGGVGRQRVYDKIISLIINGKDGIKKSKKFDCDYKLDIGKYKALKRLYEIIQESYNDNGSNIDFKQLYIELDRNGLDKIRKKKNKKRQLLKKMSQTALIILTLFSTTQDTRKVDKIIYVTPEEEALRSYPKDPEPPVRIIVSTPNYISGQEQILRIAYNLTDFDYHKEGDPKGMTRNKIIEEYDDIAEGYKHTSNEDLSAEQFMTNYSKILSKYRIKYQKPYSHLKDSIIADNKQGIEYIKNTLDNGDRIDISKHKIEEIKTKKKFKYYIEKDDQLYYLKFFRVYTDNKTSIDMIFASKEGYPETSYTLENGLLCMQDLYNKYPEGLVTQSK